jgi:hypothetical protein
MRAIGFRAEKDAILWAVVEPANASTLKLVAHGEENAAKADGVSDSLAHFRERVRLLVDEWKPNVGIVRSPETFNRKSSNLSSLDSRLRIEGVVIEALASKGVRTRTAALKGISSMMKSDAAREYLDGEQLRGIQWPKKDKNCREAILVAAAGLGYGETT